MCSLASLFFSGPFPGDLSGIFVFSLLLFTLEISCKLPPCKIQWHQILFGSTFCQLRVISTLEGISSQFAESFYAYCKNQVYLFNVHICCAFDIVSGFYGFWIVHKWQFQKMLFALAMPFMCKRFTLYPLDMNIPHSIQEFALEMSQWH